MKTTKAKKIPAIKDYRLMRVTLNLSQGEFWNRIGATQSAGSRYENGRRVPKATAILAHLIYILGAEIDARDFK